MVILKKIKASTLMETLVATVLIVVVFMVANMILNNLFSNTMKSNTRAIDAYLKELQYKYANQKLILPYNGEFKDWQISITPFKENEKTMVEFEAKNPKTNQKIVKEIHEVQ